MSAHITFVRHVRDYVLELRFADGSQGSVDLCRWIAGRGGVVGALEDPAVFRQVALDAEAGTVYWPNGVDLCPDMLHHEATGAPLPEPTTSQPGNSR